MPYPEYTVKLIVEKDPAKNVTIEGSHAFSMQTANGVLSLDFSHNNEGTDTVPSLILRVTTP